MFVFGNLTFSCSYRKITFTGKWISTCTVNDQKNERCELYERYFRSSEKKYLGEWIAFLVYEEKKEIEKIEGEVIEHHRDRRKLHERLRQKNIKNAYVTFAGPLIKPGYSVMF